MGWISTDGWLWIGWVVWFAIVETQAIIRKRRTDFIQAWRDVTWGTLDIGRFTLACGFVWLIGHFFGWW
jgi:hypothetical protein